FGRVRPFKILNQLAPQVSFIKMNNKNQSTLDEGTEKVIVLKKQHTPHRYIDNKKYIHLYI
ncbi:hypothetical protein, partial [Bacillus toyonensis]|uniref:hypothetical protein n=1 Tax=Bacillus toyonensis TaxID=155322 RepID=UPI000C014692